jgi:hypothetical protein
LAPNTFGYISFLGLRYYRCNCMHPLLSHSHQAVFSGSQYEQGSSDLKDKRAADSMREPQESVPKRRPWGFFAFLACVLAVTFVVTQRKTESSRVESAIDSDEVTSFAGKASEAAPSGAVLSEISFVSRSVESSEKSVSAVLLVKRSQPLSGDVLLQWATRSGSAAAGIDFSDALGTLHFADGQAQLSIYVPLRDDLLKESDEIFEVCLHSPQRARLGAVSCAEVTIRDDD